LREQIKEFFRFELSHAKEEERRRVVEEIRAAFYKGNQEKSTPFHPAVLWTAPQIEEVLAALTPKV